MFKYQISFPACFYYCSTELLFMTVAGMLSRDALPMDIGAKYFDRNSCLLQLTTFVNLKKFMEAYNNYNRKGRLLFDVSATFKYIIKCHPPSLPQLFCTFKTYFCHPPSQNFRFSITVTPAPRDTACHPPPPKKKF